MNELERTLKYELENAQKPSTNYKRNLWKAFKMGLIQIRMLG